MKLLFLTEFYPTTTAADVRGGVELRTFMVTQGLAKDHETMVMAEREPDTQAESMVGKVRVLRPGPIAQYRQGGGVISRLRYLWAARKQALRQKPDVLFAENFGGYTIALTLPKSWQLKTILTYHDVWIGEWIKNVGLVMGVTGELIERLVLRRKWKHVIANSNVTKDELLRHGIPAKSISVIYHGIDLEACKNIQPEQFTTPTIVSVARLVRYKRIDDLLRALVDVKKDVPDIRLVVIGSGPEEQKLKHLASNLGIADSVELRGFIRNYSNVLAAIKGATVFSLPSGVEGFGIVTLEAMACGTPYVSSDIPPTREATDGGQGGRLYPVGDSIALSRHLTTILQDAQLRQQLSDEGKKRAQSFSWNHSLQQLENVLERRA